MLRTVSVQLNVDSEQAAALMALQSAYADACNRLVPTVVEHRCWNRVALHNLAYDRLRKETPLSARMVCNAIFSVCKAYKAQKELGRIRKGEPVPVMHFDCVGVYFDERNYAIKGECLSLYTLSGRIAVTMVPGEHQRRIMASGKAKEAELVCRKGCWYFNLVVESEDVVKSEDSEPIASGPVMGVVVGENNLAATSTGKVWGGGELRHKRNCHLALCRRLQSNGSQSARQKLRQVSDKEQRRVTHINHETSKEIVAEARRIGASRIVMKDLSHIHNRAFDWDFRQLQTFVEYKARAVGIAVEYVNPTFTNQTCSNCGSIGECVRHRFVCQTCGLQTHADDNASRNLARIGSGAPLPKAAVNAPHVGDVSHVCVSQ